ncbi:MAG: ORF6N domain-containing protein [Candidatus Saccharibacteria bacterium]|nr:ORF6N domain-containing protein [Candidatus Saccharibacteria bacterium]
MVFEVRGKQVMLANDVSILYEAETKRVNETIKRNQNRFPEEFCFQLTREEVNALNLRSQFATSSLGGRGYGGARYLPHALTEQGVMMLSGLLKSDVAVRMNIKIINAFVAMRKYIGG